jgi:hypothetical protein
VEAYNHALRLKTLRGLTPYEFVYQVWTNEPDRFRLDPSHRSTGPYSYWSDAFGGFPRKEKRLMLLGWQLGFSSPSHSAVRLSARLRGAK